jgi:hypothetical protein
MRCRPTLGATRFFAPWLVPETELMRCRLVNRLFAAEEGQPNQLIKTLDQNITVVDPREAEAAFSRDFTDARTREDAERIAAERMERKLKSKEDVSMVEDFPLVPEEETPEFRDLRLTLQLRLVRAMEHWRGNTDLTLTALIVRTVNAGFANGTKESDRQ